MANHSSILAWGIPWTEEPGKRQSMGSQRIQFSSVTQLCPTLCDPMNQSLSLSHIHTHTYTRLHTHVDFSMLALSNVQPNNLSKVPFLYSVGEVRKRVCKAFGAEQDFLSTSVLDDICDQRDICCSYSSSVLQNWL